MEKKKLDWGRKTPGLLVFLLDQSGSMDIRNHAQKVAKAVHDAVYECFRSCIDGDDVLQRFNLLLIGYGSTVKELWSGWCNDQNFADKLMDANDKKSSFISAVADGGTPMAEAFDMAKGKIMSWIKENEEEKKNERIIGIPAPIVINITDGEPNSISEAERAAKEIMDIKADDGNVTIFNMHLSTDSSSEILFPSDISELKRSKYAEFLFRISSVLDDAMVSIAKRRELFNLCVGSRGLIINAGDEYISKFIRFGSLASGLAN